MKWWKKALIITGIWFVLIIGIGVVHTEVILKGKITPAQDEVISERYGNICGVGLVLIWVVAYLKRAD